MAHQDPSKIRNVTVLGHRGTGKTSLVEAMLYASGAVNRMGSVAEGSTVADFDEAEQRRGMSIAASLCHLTWTGVQVNIIDTPGEQSFHADTLSSLRAADAALMVVNATMGVEVQTERLWNRCEELRVPRAVVVNMLDRERADFDTALQALRNLSPGCVPIQVPIGREGDFRGVVNLVSMTASVYEGGAVGRDVPIPDEVADAAAAAREALVETVAEADDALIEKYLEGEEITTAELIAGLCQGIVSGRLHPVACAAGSKGIGADRVLDLIVEGLPGPDTAAGWDATDERTGEPVTITLAEEGPALAYCFKTLADQFSGRINLLRVISGVLPSDTQVVNVRTGVKERVGQLLRLQGKDHTPLAELGPGDIGAVAKLKEVVTGDVITAGSNRVLIEGVHFPAAVMSFAVTAHTQGDDDKVVSSLRRLQEEDPSLDVHRDDQTGDLIVAGLSQMHVEVIVERLRRRFGVEVDLHPPHIPYRETITASAEAEGKHKKQTGGRGQFGDCWLRVEPLPRGGGFEFQDKIVGGAIPKPFIPAVEKGVIEAMQRGELAGYPVVDCKVTLYDGKYHAVDSSEMAFKIAGSLGMKAALTKARPVLLEPI
ncbi:MAG: elongation factor, partial [Miltoncostaeaceae bacterium]|nr:elongation factor [Miltoncostaeaceae bacterium]